MMKLTKTLGLMGLIPFVISFYLSIQSATWQLESQQAFIAYSAIILSFVSGTLWKKNGLQKHDKSNIISNVFSLFAFTALLADDSLALVILTINYLALFLYEVRLANLDKQTDMFNAYIKMRLQLTIIIIGLQVSALIMW